MLLEEVLLVFLQQGLSLKADISQLSDVNYERIYRNLAYEKKDKRVLTDTAL
jgi:hypothetical protein